MKPDSARTAARICICADDFGLSEGVNEAVLRLAACERLQATSCMVFAPAWQTGAAALKQLVREQLDVGLHLDFTQCPSRPSLRQPLRSMIIKGTLGLLNTADIRTEIRVQLDAFEQAMGRPPAYVDGHQHVHQLRGIREALIDEIRQRYATSLPWVRISRGLPVRLDAGLTGWRTAAKSAVITGLGATALARRLHVAGMRSNQRLLGIYGFSQDKGTYERLLDGWMSIATDADLLMCHPGIHAAHGARGEDAIAAARLTEFAALNGDAFEAIVSARAVRLMPMSKILQTHR